MPDKRQKLLVFLSRFPYPLEKGDKLRAYHQIKELSAHFEISLICVSDVVVKEEHIAQLRQYCSEIHWFKLNKTAIVFRLFYHFFYHKPFQTAYFFSPAIKRKSDRIIERIKPDHIYCQLVRVSEYVKNYHHCPKTLDYMDALSKGMERRIEKAPWYSRWLFRKETQRLKLYERQLFEYFENHTVISEQDRNYIMHPANKRIHVVPNGVDEQFFHPPQSNKEFDLVFVGNMSYPPNVEAVQFIFHKLLKKRPALKLLISGANPSKITERMAENSTQIELSGWIEDIRESYVKGKIFVAPMMIGTGQQNKLLEAMALGIPCVTTSLANNPIGAIHLESIVVANQAEEFLEYIDLLLTDSDIYKRIAEGGRDFIRENYRWEKSTKTLVELLRTPAVN